MGVESRDGPGADISPKQKKISNDRFWKKVHSSTNISDYLFCSHLQQNFTFLCSLPISCLFTRFHILQNSGALPGPLSQIRAPGRHSLPRAVKSCQKTHPCNRSRQHRLTVYTWAYSHVEQGRSCHLCQYGCEKLHKTS